MSKLTLAEEFINVRDQVDKLSGSVVEFREDFYMISHIGERQTEIYRISDQREEGFKTELIEFRKITSDEMNYKSFNLGFVTAHNTTYYAARQPVRKTKYGLSAHNMEFHPITKPNSERAWSKGDLFGNSISTGNLRKTLCGEYGDFPSAVEHATKSTDPIPFDRDFALVRASLRAATLFYKTAPVGEFDFDSGRIDLYPSHWHLAERLEDMPKLPKVRLYGKTL